VSSGLLDDVLADPHDPGGRPCSLDRLFNDLNASGDQQTADELAQLLWGAQYAHIWATVIGRKLAERGLKVGVSSLQRHRRGDCLTCRPRQAQVLGS